MSERMKWSEAEAVVRAFRAEHGAGDVDVATLARALGTDVQEVRRLAARRRHFADASGVLSAAIALFVFLAAFLAIGPSLFTKNPLVASLMPAPRSVKIRVWQYRGPDSELAHIDRTDLERLARDEALRKLSGPQVLIQDEPL